MKKRHKKMLGELGLDKWTQGIMLGKRGWYNMVICHGWTQTSLDGDGFDIAHLKKSYVEEQLHDLYVFVSLDFATQLFKM